jgi:hypothetical protein
VIKAIAKPNGVENVKSSFRVVEDRMSIEVDSVKLAQITEFYFAEGTIVNTRISSAVQNISANIGRVPSYKDYTRMTQALYQGRSFNNYESDIEYEGYSKFAINFPGIIRHLFADNKFRLAIAECVMVFGGEFTSTKNSQLFTEACAANLDADLLVRNLLYASAICHSNFYSKITFKNFLLECIELITDTGIVKNAIMQTLIQSVNITIDRAVKYIKK